MIAAAALACLPGCFLLAAAAAPAATPAPAQKAQPAPPPPSGAAPTVAETPVAAQADEPALPPEVDIAPPSRNLPDLRQSIGRRSDGGTAPVALQMLTRAMTPDDVNRVFPGADQVSKFGISRIKAKGLPGVDHIEFSFQKGMLYKCSLHYSRALTTTAFRDYFHRVVKNKYGDTKETEILTYALRSGVMVQAYNFVDHYVMTYTPPILR